MNYRDAVARLHRLGCEEIPRRSGGSHRKWFCPMTGMATSLPDWGGRDLRLGTLRAAVRQLGLNWQKFLEA